MSPGEEPALLLGLLVIVRRQPDYPAAHSMDTTFFAVDANGRVAVFDSGSSGTVPKAAGHEGDIVRLIRQLEGTPDGDHEDEDVVDDDEYGAARDEAIRRGLFVYESLSSETEFIDPYTRAGHPDRPLHVDQMPPAVRKQFAKTRMPTADFAAAGELQIVEQVPCVFYWDQAVGYFVPGRNEVRPIPGREAKYRAALVGFRLKYRKYRFADAPEPKRKGKT